MFLEAGSVRMGGIGSKPSLRRNKILCSWVCALVFVFALAPVVKAQRTGSAELRSSNSAISLARSALAAGKPAEAVNILTPHLQSHPKDISGHLLLADAYMGMGNSVDAQAQFEAVLKLDPDNYSALAGLGEIDDRLGDSEKAEPMLARAATLSHHQPAIQIARASVLARLHRYTDATMALAGISPPAVLQEKISFYRLKAAIASGLSDAGGAASEMEKALALSPEQTGLRMATTAAELQATHWKRAESLAEPLFARTHEPQLGLMLLEAQLGAGDDIHPTLEALRSPTIPNEKELLLRQQLAELLIAHDRYRESIEELKRALELDPNRAELSFNLALAQFKAGQLDDAFATSERARKLADSAEIEDLLGDIEEARGDSLAAVHNYETAVGLAPNEERYRLSLALELIRHKSFDPARLVLHQAEQVRPESWRIQVALGMLEYFAGSAGDANRILLRASELAPNPEPALSYLGSIQMDEAGAPDSAALNRLCEYGDAHSEAAKLRLNCAALLFRKAYALHDSSQADAIIKRLSAAAKALPKDATPHCQLGKAYRWIEHWQEALRESQICVRMDPDSADAHYRLAQLYRQLGQPQQSEQEMKLYEAASTRVADENARRDEAIKTFVYSIQGGSATREAGTVRR